MIQKFTDRARKVMQMANQEAQRFNHEYIGTEHILLGLVKEGSGLAANVLKNLNIDLRKIRLEVEKLVQSGPDMVMMGKLPQTPRAKKVVDYALEIAIEWEDDHVGTEHILMGLLKEDQGVAAQVLMNLGLNLSDVKAEVFHLLPRGGDLLEDEIQQLYIKKEDAIVNQNFEFAASLRSQIDELKLKRNPKLTIETLKRLVLQQADITTEMLKLLKELQ